MKTESDFNILALVSPALAEPIAQALSPLPGCALELAHDQDELLGAGSRRRADLVLLDPAVASLHAADGIALASAACEGCETSITALVVSASSLA